MVTTCMKTITLHGSSLKLIIYKLIQDTRHFLSIISKQQISMLKTNIEGTHISNVTHH